MSSNNRTISLVDLTAVLGLTHRGALDWANANGAAIHMYGNPTEVATSGVGADFAADVAAEDPSLIYITFRITDRAGLWAVRATR